MRRGASSGGFRASKSARSTSPKGQIIRRGKAVQYAVKDKGGQTKYIGSTNNPTRRAAEHHQSGKMRPGDKLEVQSRAISRGKAESLERGRLQGHRREHGRNPQHNVTSDGQFKRRLF